MKLHYEDVDIEIDIISGRHSISDLPENSPKIPFAFKAHGMLARESLEAAPAFMSRIFPLSILGKVLQEAETEDPFVDYDDAERVLLNSAVKATSGQIKATMEALLIFYEDAKADEAEMDAMNDAAERSQAREG